RNRLLLASSRLSDTESRLLTIDPSTGAATPGVMVNRPLSGLTIMPCPAPCFDQPSNISVGGLLTALKVVDVTGDGNMDIVIADRNDRVVLLPGNGNGTFQPALIFPLPTGSTPVSIAFADLNGDLKM